MEGRKAQYLKDINELLAVLESNLRLNGKNHYFDLHTGAEDPICGLLNLLFGYQLVNVNHEKMNYPGIDLADRDRRIAVQVTSDGEREKVIKTLKAFDREAARRDFDRILLVIMGRKPAYRKPFDTRGLSLEILSLDDLSRIICGKEDAVVERITSYLRNAFVFQSNGTPPRLHSTETDAQALLEQLPVMQEHYLHRFRNVLIRGAQRNLSLQDLYIPNPYVIGKSPQTRDDLPELMEHFVNGDLSEWLNAEDVFNTLIVEGQQCTGKSTLVAELLHRAYFRWKMPVGKVHLLSFVERDLRSMKLTARNVCDFLGLDPGHGLRDGLLIIDAFDESDWPSQNAREQLEILMDDLIKYRCTLIVTTRKNYLDTADLDGILSITLRPFTLDHAERWLDIYGTSDAQFDAVAMKADLRAVPEELAQVILLPHVLQICVTHRIALGSVVNLNQLYDLVFRGPNGLFLRDQYFPNPRAQYRRLQQMLGTAVQISIRCMQQDNLISAGELEAFLASGGPQMERLKTEYLLERRDRDHYAFAHKSIPSYLIALDLYEAFSAEENSMPDDALLDRIAPIVNAAAVLTGDVIRALEKMSVPTEPGPGTRAERLLHRFLKDELDAELLYGSGLYRQAEARYERWFDALVRLVLALKAGWWDQEGEYRFFETLDREAHDRFIRFFNQNKTEGRSWDYIRHSKMDNWTLTGMDLGRTDLQSKRIRAMVMHAVGFEGANLRLAYLLDSDLSAVRFDKANCVATQFSKCILCSASFRDAKLQNAFFVDCDLSHADLRGANLSKVSFENCVLSGVKIDAGQLSRHRTLLDLETIRRNRIRLYIEDCELPEELVEDEYRRQRPAMHSIRHNKEIFTGGNVRKAEFVRRTIENHPGPITRAKIVELCPRVSQSTIQRVLTSLIQSGLVRKVGAGRATAYVWTGRTTT